MPVYLECLDCGHTWMIFGKVIREHGEEVIKVGIFDDLCPICESQGEVFDITEDALATTH